MSGKRFGVGDALAIVGAVGAGVGLILYWWVLQIDAKEGHVATLSYSGTHDVLAWVAAGLAWVAGVVALFKLAGALKPGRTGALVVLVLGVAAAGTVGIAIASGPSSDTLHNRATDVFSQKTVDDLKAAESGKTDLKGSVEYGIGLWITLAAGAIVALGGLLKLVTEKSRAAWPYGAPAQPAAAPGMPYGQAAPPGYAQAPPAGPPPGFAVAPVTPPMMGPGAATGAPPMGYASPAAPPAAPPVAPVPAPVATSVVAAAAPPATPSAAGPSEGATTTSAAPADGSPPGQVPVAGFCGACGAPFADDAAKFCMKCGAARPGP
jgi:hypothetical protein